MEQDVFNEFIPHYAKITGKLSLSAAMEAKATEYVEYAKRVASINPKMTNCVIIGCPQRLILPLVNEIANRLNTKARFLSGMLIEKENDMISFLTNCNEGDIIALSDIQKMKPKLKKILEQAVKDNATDIIVGKGKTASSYHLPLPSFTLLFIVNSKQDLPGEFEEDCFFEIDFSSVKSEVRRSLIMDILSQSGLTADEAVLDALSKNNFSESVLKSIVIKLRNRALAKGIKTINSDFLNDKIDTIPKINEVDIMEGRDFEIFTGDLLRSNGFMNIRVTPSSGDFGADVIAEKDDVRYAIQCKRYDSPVGISAVQEVIASKSLHDCHVACVLTNSSFTPAAVELARKNLVILWDRNKLKNFIDKANT